MTLIRSDILTAATERLVLACPTCKTALSAFVCPGCARTYEASDGIADLLSNSPTAQKYRQIAAFYDSLYDGTGNTWEELARRGSQFNAFIAGLVKEEPVTSVLDVGCGKGHLLGTVDVPVRCGIEISRRALVAAQQHARAVYAIASAEELPYPADTFDAVTSIGVMTHFLDDAAATREIGRVLRPGGRYIIGVYVRSGRMDRVIVALRRHLDSTCGAVEVLRSAATKVAIRLRRFGRRSAPRRDKQPIELFYTRRALIAKFAAAGFQIERLITKRNHPDAPMADSNFSVYVLRKPLCRDCGRTT